MKNIFFTFCCCLFGINMASAQYYFSTYGSPASEDCWSGTTTTGLGTDGYMLVGAYKLGTGHSTNVVWTDPSGAILGNYFNKTFDFGANSSLATDVIQHTNSSFYVVGWMEIGPDIFPYMMELDNTGAFISCRAYTFLGSAMGDLVKITSTNDNTGDMYITSHYDHGPGVQSIIAMRVDVTGSVIWANVYDILDPNFNIQTARAADIIESPWTSQGPNQELYIFGSSRTGATGTVRPTVMIIDGTTGALATTPVIQHLHGVDAQYSSCDISNDYGGGFVAAGLIQTGAGSATVNTLTTNMNWMGVKNWCTMHDNSVNPGEYNSATGVKERYNTNFKYETYTVGAIYNSQATSANNIIRTQVLKIDDTGNLIKEFLVASGRNDIGKQLDFDPNGDGLAVFGNLGTASTNDEMFTAKMYFNGVMECYGDSGSFISNPVDINIANPLATSFTLALTPTTMTPTINTLSTHQDCFSLSVGGGTNLLTIKETNKETVQFHVNQLKRNISIEAPVAQENNHHYQVAVYDLTGKQVLNLDRQVMPGSKTVINLDAYGLSSGYYLFKVSNNGKMQSLKVFIGE